MNSATTIGLADDHPVVRQGLRALLEVEPDLRVVGEAADAVSTIEMVIRLAPDVLILDLVMPGGGLEVLRALAARQTATRVVVLSMHATEGHVLTALQEGASAYVVKDATASDLVHAVREAVAGRRFLSPPLSQRAIEAYARGTRATTRAPHSALTAREIDVLRLSAQGYTLQQVGVELSISRRTAETHRAHLMRKLGLHNQTDVVLYAMRHGILPPDS